MGCICTIDGDPRDGIPIFSLESSQFCAQGIATRCGGEASGALLRQELPSRVPLQCQKYVPRYCGSLDNRVARLEDFVVAVPGHGAPAGISFFSNE